tara:strand:- start:3567 stop:4085 length:519 start_codon:yes stop_codon:yes gene_type:complete
MSLFGNCENPIPPCPGCVDNQTLFVPAHLRNAESTLSFKFGAKRQTAYNGLKNTKNFRTSASSFVILKKSLATVQPNNKSDLNSSSKAGVTCCGGPATGTPGGVYDEEKGPSNTGGPGDAVESVPIVTSRRSGWKGRLVTLPHQTGVDVKHNSYERYLARKRGWAMRCQNCK